ncbi:MAG: hypothetical protein ABIK43_05030 [candidate division WOR-3 bacterium]
MTGDKALECRNQSSSLEQWPLLTLGQPQVWYRQPFWQQSLQNVQATGY